MITRQEALLLYAEDDYVKLYNGIVDGWGDRLNHFIPDHMHGGVIRWVCFGIRPGSFLTAVLKHDLFEAVRSGDEENQDALVGWVKFFYNYAPTACHGADNITTWKGVWPDAD